MEKKHVIFALKLFIAGVLLGILAGFLGVNPSCSRADYDDSNILFC